VTREGVVEEIARAIEASDDYVSGLPVVDAVMQSDDVLRTLNQHLPDAEWDRAFENLVGEPADVYKSSHWREPNVVGHIRVTDRPTYKTPLADVERRIQEAIGVDDPKKLGSGAPATAVRKGAITEDEAANYSFFRGFLNVPKAEAPTVKTLYVDELQSDWGQEGRESGFRPKEGPPPEPFTALQVEQARARALATIKANDNLGFDLPTEALQIVWGERSDWRTRWDLDDADAAIVQDYLDKQEARTNWRRQQADARPRGPFVMNTDAWLTLLLKRVVKLAVDEGYERVAFTTGDRAAKAMRISQQVNRIDWGVMQDPSSKRVIVATRDNGMVTVFVDKDGKVTSGGRNLNAAIGTDLRDLLGRELGQQIISQDEGHLEGLQLDVGGEGMRGFYDKIVPATVNKLLAKLGGGRVRTMQSGTDLLVGFDVTDKMRDAARAGLPLFAQGDTRTVQVDGIRRPITDSRGRLIDPAHQGQVNFWRWAGKDVKSLDRQGRPIVFFHATDKDLTEFEHRRTYFTPAADYASGSYASPDGGRLMPVYLRVTNPLDLRQLGDKEIEAKRFFATLDAAGVDTTALRGPMADRKIPVWMWMLEPSINNTIRAAGFDAVQQMESTFHGTGEAWKVFDSRFQVKSAIGNNGQYDSGTADIRFAQRRPSGSATTFGTLTAAQEQALRNVGGIVPTRTIAERWGEFKQNLGLRMKQGIVDQFAPIKDVDQRAYMLARMSKGSDGTMEALLMYGKPFLRDGVPDVNVNQGGFAAVLATLKGEHDRFLWWVAAQRAERLKAEGRENLFTDQDISALKTLAAGSMADGSDRRRAYDAALTKLNEFNDAVLEMAEASGLIDPEARALFKDQPYVPFYRVMEDQDLQGPRFSSGLVNQRAWQRLKGGTAALNHDLLENMLLNWAHLYSASARNRAAIETLDAAERLAVAYPARHGAKDTVRVMRDGVAHQYEIADPYLLEAVTALYYTPSPLMAPLAKMKKILTFGVTVNPAFKVRNLLRDSVSALGLADLSYNPLKNVAQGWKATSNKSQTYASMLASGGLMRFGTLENSEHLRAKVEKLGGKLATAGELHTLKVAMENLWETYQELGDRGENVNRAALYQQLIAKGATHAEAAYQARDLMDFSMSGKWPVVRFLAQTVPFLNARLQGLYKLGRAAAEDPRRFATIAAAVSMASLALLAAYHDDEDWKKREDWDRDNYWWFKIGSTAYRIPKPFEIGAIGTMAERTAELFFSKEMTADRYMDRVAFMLGQTFSLNPVPQAFSPLVDVYANRNAFLRRPIENFSDERLPAAERYDENTSELGRFLGALGLPEPIALVKGEYRPLSPKQVDHLMRGYFGWVGASIASVTDYALRPAMDRGERPSRRDGVGFIQELPAGSSRYVTAFYEQAKDIEQAYAAYRQAVREGDTDKAREIEAEGKVQNHIAVGRVRNRLDELNTAAKAIERNRLMSAETKRERLDAIEQQRQRIAEDFASRGPR
jgi:hypothetical protein